MKYFLICSSVLLLLATNVLADDHPLSAGEQVIQACTVKGPSHVAAMNCEGDKKEEFNKKLQEVYKLALADAQKMDKRVKDDKGYIDPKNPPSIKYHYVKDLTDSQKAFETYRDKECYRMRQTVAGGNSDGDVDWGCTIDLDNERTQALKRTYDCGNDGCHLVSALNAVAK